MGKNMNDPKHWYRSPKQPLPLFRVVDILCSGLALLVLAPVFLTIATIIKLSSAGSVFTRVKQVGKDGHDFTLYRFRKTCRTKEKPKTNAYDQGDLLITPVGHFLGTHKLDELTKLIDVFLGHKSLVKILPYGRNALNLRQLVSQLRNRHMLFLDFIVLLLIPSLAMTLLVDSLTWWSELGWSVVVYTLLALMIQLAIFYKMGLYNCYWQYAGTHDLAQVALAVGTSTVILTALSYTGFLSLAVRDLAIYRSLPLVVGLMTFVAIGGARFGIRGLFDLHHRNRQGVAGKRRLLIAGAGETGTLAAREIQTHSVLPLEVVAFVDDDPHKVGTQIEGLPVVGSLDMIPQLVEEMKLQEIIVAIPSAPLKRQIEIIALCKQSGVHTSSLPGIYEILAGYKTISSVPQLDLNDLLNRQPIATDQSDVRSSLKGAKVLVTGAGGSIGSELCRQIAQCDPAEIVLLGHGENSIFDIGLRLRMGFPDLVTCPVIVDIRDEKGIDWIIAKNRPDIILHAAAHKHVPFMEEHVSEAITNNVQGTLNVLRAAKRHDVPRLVLISSDKAVNPTSTMGVTKRISELLVQATAHEGDRAYMSVRFGNVLGSRGSVVPIFQWQIQAGGPLTVTHPEMRRYFMTIPEAVELVLQAAVLGKGGEVFVLDMGEQIRILDLASRIVRRSGFKLGRDIDVVFSGIRPGEKLEEELFQRNEEHNPTKHDEIFVAMNNQTVDNEILEKAAMELIDLAYNRQLGNIDKKMQAIVANYQPQQLSPARMTIESQSQVVSQSLDINLKIQAGQA